MGPIVYVMHLYDWVGLPGTGKTLLAKAVADEAEVPFISCSSSEFVELYVGMGASRVRDLFVREKKEAPSIIFIEEIDVVAKSRACKFCIASNDEREQTLNQLLTDMDGFDSNSAVIVLGATNRSDVLDPALCRPGRFDRVVMVETPDRIGRKAILKVHVSKKELPLGQNVDLVDIASMTTCFTGAELANLVNEAALLAGRQNKDVVEKIDFIQAVERSIAIRFNKGMFTSSNMSIQTHDIRFRNKICYCRLRAAVRIFESEKNPGKLYYDCPREKDKGKCKFWDWCNPIGYGETNSVDEAHVQLRNKDDARLGVIEINVANLKHIINILVFCCGLALVVSVMALVK